MLLMPIFVCIKVQNHIRMFREFAEIIRENFDIQRKIQVQEIFIDKVNFQTAGKFRSRNSGGLASLRHPVQWSTVFLDTSTG